jgi:hypothetical protein
MTVDCNNSNPVCQTYLRFFATSVIKITFTSDRCCKIPVSLIDVSFGELTAHRVRKSLEEEELMMS